MAFGRKETTTDEAQTDVNPQLETATTAETMKAKKNAASKKMMAKKKAALKLLVDLAKRLGDDSEKGAAAYLNGENRASGPHTASPAVSILTTLFADTPGTVIGEGEVFKITKMGRSEMRAQIKKAVQHDDYIVFNAVEETYTFVGKEKPADWTGPNKAAPKL